MQSKQSIYKPWAMDRHTFTSNSPIKRFSIFNETFFYVYRSARKRRISYSQEDLFGVADLGDMSECNAALVLMSLSHSPNSSIQGESSSWQPDFVIWIDAAFASCFELYFLLQTKCHVSHSLRRLSLLRQCPIVQRFVIAAFERRWQRQQQQYVKWTEVHHQEQPQTSESAHGDCQ